MMLALFYVHDVMPGPQLFAQHPDLICALYSRLFLLDVIVVVFVIFSTQTLMRVIEIPNRLLARMILTFSLIGVYTLQNSLTDERLPRPSAFSVLS